MVKCSIYRDNKILLWKSGFIFSEIVVVLSQMESYDLLHFVNCLFFVSESYMLSVSGGVFSIPDKSPISWFIPWACLTRSIFCGEIPLADTIFNGVRACKHKNNTKCASCISVWHYPVICVFTLKGYWHSSQNLWDVPNKSSVFQNVFKVASFSQILVWSLSAVCIM